MPLTPISQEEPGVPVQEDHPRGRPDHRGGRSPSAPPAHAADEAGRTTARLTITGSGNECRILTVGQGRDDQRPGPDT